MAYGIVSSQTTIQSTGAIYLTDVTGVVATAASKRVSLVWSDPEPVKLNGAVLARWEKTLVVRKVGSAPTDRNDGTIIVINTIKDQYKTTPFVDTGLTNGTVYYYRFFPVSKDGVYTDSEVVSARPAVATVTIPTITSTHTYDTTEQTPTVSGFDDTKMTKSGDIAKTNAGDYNLVFTLVSDDYIWDNGQHTPQTIPWSIAKAAGGLSVSKATTKLNTKVTSDTITITQTGDGELSVTNSDSTVVSAVVSGTNLTISRVGTNVGSATITINAAESNNYTAAQVTVAVSADNYITMTVKIDQSNSNPETCCTYADDAVGMEPGSADWDEFFGHYPVLFKDGAEVVKINPNNYAQDINGNSIDITSGDAGDVMVAFPRRGLKISTSEDDIVTISMTDNPNNPNFDYYAHQRGTTDKDVFYLGAYKGYIVSSKLRSLSGKPPTINKDIDDFRTLARANSPASDGSGGSGYDQSGFFQLTYRQAMYVLKYKNLDSQSAVGKGYAEYGNTFSKMSTGGTDIKGLDFGETNDTRKQMKLFGLEDFWGNIYEWIDGLYCDSNWNILVGSEGFNNTGENYINCGQGTTANLSGFIDKIQGTSEMGFLPKGRSGSSTTYYCDYGDLFASLLPIFGGSYDDRNYSIGVFCLHVRSINSTSYCGARLMYL